MEMYMVFLIAGVVLTLIAVGLLFGSKASAEKAFAIRATETSRILDLLDLSSSIAKDLGPGSFRQIAEVKGITESANPLRSELAQQPCVYYSMKVTREFEETYWETDSQGNRSQRTRRGSQIVSSNQQQIPFEVNDGSGKVTVDASSAKLDTMKAHSSFVAGENNANHIGNFILNLTTAFAGGTRTIGYKYEEDIIPLGRQVYVLGEASDKDGTLKIVKPENKKDAPFLVSLKSEDELLKSAQGSSSGMKIGAIVALVLGLGSATLGILKLINLF